MRTTQDLTQSGVMADASVRPVRQTAFYQVRVCKEPLQQTRSKPRYRTKTLFLERATQTSTLDLLGSVSPPSTRVVRAYPRLVLVGPGPTRPSGPRRRSISRLRASPRVTEIRRLAICQCTGDAHGVAHHS